MANDFDQFPLYEAISKSNGTMTDVWIGALSFFYQNLIGYLTQFGILLPVVTTAQRDAIQSPQEGQMIYNSDATPGPPRSAEIQVWQVKAGVGAWRVFTTT